MLKDSSEHLLTVTWGVKKGPATFLSKCGVCFLSSTQSQCI